MNIFLAQSIQTKVELEEIACVEKQIINPSMSKTANGTKQDGLIGSYNLSSPSLKVDWRNAMNLISYTTIEDFDKIPKGENMSGTKLYSFIVPPKINFKASKLKIKNGEITEGKVTAEALGEKKKNTLTQLIWDEYGTDVTENFIDNTRWLSNNFNLWHGFSVGYGDVMSKKEIMEQIDNLFNTKKVETEYLITEIENNPDLMSKNILELEMFGQLKSFSNDVEKIIMANLPETNAFKIMEASGSKGNASNIANMMGSVGLQTFEGKLMPTKYNGRTLVYYHQNDDTPVSRGLIRNSYHEGLDFPNYVYQSSVGRSGLIDAAIKTADTGYMQRKLVKSLEDVHIKYDGTVRNANNNIIQFVYGDAGTDPTTQFECEIKLLDMNNEQLENNYCFTEQELKNYPDFSTEDNKKFYKLLKELRDVVRKSVRKAKLDYLSKINTFWLPINITRIVENIKNYQNKNNKKDLTPSHILNKIDELLSNDKTPLLCMTNKEKINNKSLKYKDENALKSVLTSAIYDFLSPKKILLEYNMDKEIFDDLIEELSNIFIKNMAEPGEMVGAIAATATGEPLTQMSLKSFHQAGHARTNANNAGVPRMKEIFSVTKNLKAPQMVIYLNDDIKQKKEIARKIASHIKYTVFGEIRDRITAYYDPNPKFTDGITKKDNIIPVPFSSNNNGKSGKSGCQSDITNLPWLIRIELNREKMVEKEIKLLDIISQFCNWWDIRFMDSKNIKKEERKVMNKITQIAVLSNSDNDIEQIIHIRFNAKDNDKDKFDKNTINDFIEYILDKFKLKGINDITDIFSIPEDKSFVFDEKTGDNKQEAEYIIITEGVNLQQIRYIDGIDATKTFTNDIVEMYNNFGIEVARSILIYELYNAYKNAGGDVNYQHIEMIVDQMTMSGGINSIDRHGLNKSDADPLARASFEKPVEQLWSAAVFGETDGMNSVSSRIMAGLCIKGGTGMCDLILNTKMIEEADYVESKIEMDGKKYEQVKTENITHDILKKDDEEIFMPC